MSQLNNKKSVRSPRYVLVLNGEVLAEGTKREISEQLGVKMETLSLYKRPAYAKRRPTGRRLIRIEEWTQ